MKADFILLILFSQSLSAAPLARDNYLLIDQAGIDAAKHKADSQPWAKAAMADIVNRADRDLKREVTLPPRGGQWPHWYSCKKDGSRLVADSPTSHRCPVCGTVYHGEPYDSVVFYGQHASWAQTIRNFGLAYRFTGKAEYAARAGAILTAYADRYAGYPLHDKDGHAKVGGGHIMAQTLDESVWLIPVAFGYALAREALAADVRSHIEKDLLVAAADVIRNHRMSIHNIQCWKNSAVGVAGFAAGNEALVREAIDDPQRGLRVQLEKGVTAEGLWYEGSMGYHFYTVDAIWPLAEAARLNGVNVYNDRYRSMFDAPLNLALPNGDSPGFNDNSGGNVKAFSSLYELAFARWKKPEFGRLAAASTRQNLNALLYGEEKLPKGSFIPESSVLMKSAGFAMLRSGGSAVAVRFGMHGGGHGHPDKLNIVTYAAGHLFGLDPGSINYGVPLHKEWYRATIAHNTIAVDGKDQSNADGELENWGGNSLIAKAGAAYPGVMLRRSLALDNQSLRDQFECSSEIEHDYDYAFHSAGKLTTSLKFTPRAALPYLHVEKVTEASADGDWWAEWNQDGVRYRLNVKGVPGTTIFAAEGPGRDPAVRVPMIIVRRRAKQTTFECTHEMGLK